MMTVYTGWNESYQCKRVIQRESYKVHRTWNEKVESIFGACSREEFKDNIPLFSSYIVLYPTKQRTKHIYSDLRKTKISITLMYVFMHNRKLGVVHQVRQRHESQHPGRWYFFRQWSRARFAPAQRTGSEVEATRYKTRARDSSQRPDWSVRSVDRL